MPDPTHSRRLLIETWCSAQSVFRDFLMEVNKKKVTWGQLFFAMVAKEKTTNRVGRLFTYSTMRVRSFYSTLERNMKDSIFPDVSQQTMTLAEVQLHKRLMEHNVQSRHAKRRTWKVLLSLAFLCSFIYLFIYFYLFIYLFILFIHLFIYFLYVFHLFIYLIICSFIYLFIYLHLCACICI